MSKFQEWNLIKQKYQFKKLEGNENAANFLSIILDSFENLGMSYVPPLLLSEYQGNHKQIQEGLKHLLDYLEEEEN